MALTWGEFKEWVSQFAPDNVEIHFIDVEFPREDRVDIDIDKDRGLGISCRYESKDSSVHSGVAKELSAEETQDKMSERSIRAFFGELLALCERFAVVHLQASPCDRQVVAHFGVFGQGKIVSYSRGGEPTICTCKRDMLGRVVGDEGWWAGDNCTCEANVGP